MKRFKKDKEEAPYLLKTRKSTVQIMGRTTIPKVIRDYCELEEGDKVEWFLYDNGRIEIVFYSMIERVKVTPKK